MDHIALKSTALPWSDTQGRAHPHLLHSESHQKRQRVTTEILSHMLNSWSHLKLCLLQLFLCRSWCASHPEVSWLQPQWLPSGSCLPSSFSAGAELPLSFGPHGSSSCSDFSRQSSTAAPLPREVRSLHSLQVLHDLCFVLSCTCCFKHQLCSVLPRPRRKSGLFLPFQSSFLETLEVSVAVPSER